MGLDEHRGQRKRRCDGNCKGVYFLRVQFREIEGEKNTFRIATEIIYITDERWEHIYQEHPDMIGYDDHLRETLRNGRRKQDEFDSNKYFYTKKFNDLINLNNHIVAVVKFGQTIDDTGQELPNNFLLTAYQNFF